MFQGAHIGLDSTTCSVGVIAFSVNFCYATLHHDATRSCPDNPCIVYRNLTKFKRYTIPNGLQLGTEPMTYSQLIFVDIALYIPVLTWLQLAKGIRNCTKLWAGYIIIYAVEKEPGGGGRGGGGVWSPH